MVVIFQRHRLRSLTDAISDRVRRFAPPRWELSSRTAYVRQSCRASPAGTTRNHIGRAASAATGKSVRGKYRATTPLVHPSGRARNHGAGKVRSHRLFGQRWADARTAHRTTRSIPHGTLQRCSTTPTPTPQFAPAHPSRASAGLSRFLTGYLPSRDQAVTTPATRDI